MDNQYFDKEKTQNLLRDVKPYFKQKLGKNTHKKISEDWYFYGLAFTRADMVYVFGFNLGFFKHDESENYDYAGMNVLVRTNGERPEERQKYLAFFRENLADWVNMPESTYTSERGGVGVKFARYKTISEFSSEAEIETFFKGCIDGVLNNVYPKIVENPGGIFSKVVLAAPQWDEGIIKFCKEHL